MAILADLPGIEVTVCIEGEPLVRSPGPTFLVSKDCDTCWDLHLCLYFSSACWLPYFDIDRAQRRSIRSRRRPDQPVSSFQDNLLFHRIRYRAGIYHQAVRLPSLPIRLRCSRLCHQCRWPQGSFTSHPKERIRREKRKLGADDQRRERAGGSSLCSLPFQVLEDWDQ